MRVSNSCHSLIFGLVFFLVFLGSFVSSHATELGMDQFECSMKGNRDPLTGKDPKPCDKISEESKVQILRFCAQVHDWLVEKGYRFGQVEYCSVGDYYNQIVFLDGPIQFIHIVQKGDKNRELAGLSISLVYYEPNLVGAWPNIDCWDIRYKENIMVQNANRIRASYTQCGMYWHPDLES